MRQRYLVTGGAGFVGSHCVHALHERGAEIVVLDDLQQGHAASLPRDARLVCGSVGDAALRATLLADGPWDAVFHFAALSIVADSMRAPLDYFRANAADGMAFIADCVGHGVKKFVLSSTAAVYGTPDGVPIAEDSPLRPDSPYGESKLMLERALHWAGRVHGLRYAALRYFNAAGADPAGRIGEHHAPETHLIPLAIDAALERAPPLTVFGGDYATPDGTAIRDYIHVTDLADAHLRALACLEDRSVTLNVGIGRGRSVRDVIDAVARQSGRPVPHTMGPRRAGDPAELVACSERLTRETGWFPQHSSLDVIVQTALAWRLAHPGGFSE